MSVAVKKRLLLSVALLCGVVAVIVIYSSRYVEKTPYYAQQLDAAKRMNTYMQAVKDTKDALGIATNPNDIFNTGMLGEEFNGITTTLGRLEAKRTTANSDMAAMVVRMFNTVGLQKGSVVGAAFSGSFPAMNLAVLAACESMGVSIIYIPSVGSSTYGANNPNLTFPEMTHMLYTKGLLSTDSAVVTMGGGQDIGIGMDEIMRNTIEERLKSQGMVVLKEPDYNKNIESRIKIYNKSGMPDCFVSVGGNITSLGNSEKYSFQETGLVFPEASSNNITDSSGLLSRYLAMGVPVINLLNIKKTVLEFGLPYDPVVLQAPGEAAVYYTQAYKKPLIVFSLLIVTILLVLYRCLQKEFG